MSPQWAGFQRCTGGRLRPVAAAALVRLFASVLRRDPDGFHLVTPAEKLKITVEDAPFTAIGLEREEGVLRFVTNVGDIVEAGPDNAIAVRTSPGGEPRPYLHVRAGLEALILRPVFYELVELGEMQQGPAGSRLMVGPGIAASILGSWRADVSAHREFIASRLLPLDGYVALESAGEEHAPAAVLVPLIDRPEGMSVLLTLRTPHLRRHAGQIAFPGGRADPGETPWQTALREAQEEVGLDPALVDLAGLSEPFWTRTGYVITPVVGFVSPTLTIEPNPDEVAEVFEVPFAFLMDAANHHNLEREFPDGVKRTVLAMPYEGRHIWGITAMLLRALHARLYPSEHVEQD